MNDLQRPQSVLNLQTFFAPRTLAADSFARHSDAIWTEGLVKSFTVLNSRTLSFRPLRSWAVTSLPCEKVFLAFSFMWILARFLSFSAVSGDFPVKWNKKWNKHLAVQRQLVLIFSFFKHWYAYMFSWGPGAPLMARFWDPVMTNVSMKKTDSLPFMLLLILCIWQEICWIVSWGQTGT